jgi:hypothetical protein
MNTPLQERLQKIMNYYNVKPSVFEKQCGLGNGYTKKIKNYLGEAKVQSILEHYPEIDRIWLVSGGGDMLKQVGNINKNTINGTNIIDSGNQVIYAPATDLIDLLRKKDEQIEKLLAIIEKNKH